MVLVLIIRITSVITVFSQESFRIAISDPYVKAIRWASDRIKEEEIIAFDGRRQELEKCFDKIYVFDLGGNVRKNPKLSGSTHNVFGIQVSGCEY